jgi:hypothetical protein
VQLVRTSFFLFTRTFISDDLPTLERPAKAISGYSDLGYSPGLVALVMNSALLTITMDLPFMK